MTTAGPPRSEGQDEPGDDTRSTADVPTADKPTADAPTARLPMADADVDAAFSEIIAGISGRMNWDADTGEMDAGAEAVAGSRTTGSAPPADPASSAEPVADTAEDRRLRRELRRAQRAEELAEFQAAQSERDNEMLFDTEHFEPPEPPPLPRPRARTVWAVALLVVGVVFLAAPPLLNISGNAMLVLGLLLVLGGFSLFVSGLTARRGEPGQSDGWDDGARL
jgi:hypothetical protein